MLRSGFLLGVSAPAAILTLLVHPMVQASADQWVPMTTVAAPGPAAFEARPLPGMRPVSIAIRPSRVASLQSEPNRAVPAASDTAQEMGTKPPLKPRRMMREGCEAALSSLVGPEARRMIPGRCIS
ncbi:hypothetical protein MKK70_08620 [Methylobacterium sp. E-041]|uniref:hypothetical protein n=1 Tax=Methylobacterium sp. E-041 TaxID=2836573 RepID=UPI001FBB67DE|nr:hypothetical protein [Methylobacterium sp. E-041]MCJ2105442.1 hypothetical protein [Methylobacterium sp. E-041]